MKQHGRLRKDFYGSFRKYPGYIPSNDWCYLSESSQNCRKFEKKRASSRCIGRTKGGLNTKLHVVCDFDGRSIRTLLTAGTISDYGGAACLLPTLPSTRILFADRGYDAGWIRSFLKNRGCTPCIPSRKNTRVMSITTRNNISSITR